MAIVGDQADLYTPPPGRGFLPSALESLPGTGTTMAWNISRVSRTITEGGTAGRASRIGRRIKKMTGYADIEGFGEYLPGASRGMGGMLSPGGGLTQTLQPWRLTRAANIDPSAYGEHSHIYTPFQGLSGIGNGIMKRVQKPLEGKVPAVMKNLMGDTPFTEGEKMFSPGTMGRIRSFSAISDMGARKFESRGYKQIAASIADINPTYYRDSFLPGIEGLTGDAARFGYRSGVGSTITGRVSGRLAGYVQGAEAAAAERGGMEGAKLGAQATAKGFFAEGVEGGIHAFESGTTFGRIAGSGAITGALKGASAASWILLAHDLAEGAGKLVAGTVKVGIEAAQSVKGSIDKPIMGMGFKDNSVAQTSRQRGVMAIQNSRLNARSVLGSEASMMNARFG